VKKDSKKETISSQWAKPPKKTVWRSAFLLIRHSKQFCPLTFFLTLGF